MTTKGKQQGPESPKPAVESQKTNESIPDFGAWKIVQLGHSGREYLSALDDAGFQVDGWVRDVLSQPEFQTPPVQRSIQLINVSVADLGFDHGASYDAICSQAAKLGLALCPPEVGPALRLLHKEQPDGEWLRVATKILQDRKTTTPGIFLLGHKRKRKRLSLHGELFFPPTIRLPQARFVFMRTHLTPS